MIIKKGEPIKDLPKKFKRLCKLEQVCVFFPRSQRRCMIEVISVPLYCQIKPGAEMERPKFVALFTLTNQLAFYPFPDKDYHIEVIGLIRVKI